MGFLASELIRKKRFGGIHTREEIQFFIHGYATNKIPDYQMSAWLMAICCNGMSGDETTWLTQEMRDSGKVLDLSSLGVTVDKHSTGGIGDKISLILAPVVAAAGVPVPMMAGRGLGHTGGTLDKLESIPGFSVSLSFKQFEEQVISIGTAIMGQTLEICPADRKMYALRDVTGTIDSLPLICGSIMSKKLAEGMSALVLDVKYGSGAFMKTLENAERLARSLMDIGTRSGHKVTAMLTRMDEPLGRFIGNALEVRECMEIMSGKKPVAEGKDYSDVIELTLELAGEMIWLGERAASPTEGKALAERILSDGRALQKFETICKWQGGNLNAPLNTARESRVIESSADGYLRYENLERMGSAAIVLGAGRRITADMIDFGAGIEVFRENGARVKRGDPLFKLYASEVQMLDEAVPLMAQSYSISPSPVQRSKLIAKVIR